MAPRDEIAPSGPDATSRSGPPGRAEATNFAVFAPEATACWVCLFDDDGVETRAPAHRADARRLARRSPRRAGRAALRLPRRRPVGPDARAPVQPREAAARPLRPRDHRRRGRRPGDALRYRRGRPDGRAAGSTRPARCRARWSSTTTSTGATTTTRSTRWRDTVIYELHVKGFTQLHNECPSTCAARTPGSRTPAVIELPQGPRRHRGRAAAGAPLPHRAGASPSAGWRTTGATTRSASSHRTRLLVLRVDRGQQVTRVQGRW